MLGRFGHYHLPLPNVGLMAQCCTAAKIALTIWGSISGSQFVVDSAFYSSVVNKMSTQLAGGQGRQCIACISKLYTTQRELLHLSWLISLAPRCGILESLLNYVPYYCCRLGFQSSSKVCKMQCTWAFALLFGALLGWVGLGCSFPLVSIHGNVGTGRFAPITFRGFYYFGVGWKTPV